MPWFIVPYATDPNAYPVIDPETGKERWVTSRTLTINAELPYLLGREDNDLFLEIEVRGNRAVCRVEGKALKVLDLTGKYYRLPDLLDEKLDKGDLLNLRLQTLDMGYTDEEIDAAFPDGLANVSVKDYINFAQSRLFEMTYDVKTATVIETDIPRGSEFKPKDPVDVDERVKAGKTLAASNFEQRLF